MFNRDDASQLRASLSPIDFRRPVEPTVLLRRYIDHYGLDFGDQGFPVFYTIGTIDSECGSLVCQSFQPPENLQKGSVFLLHGYLDHTGIYGHLIRHCLGLGMVVVILDFPGHGLSEGEPASITSFRQYTAALHQWLQLAQDQQLKKPWALIGQSTGGAILVDYLLHEESSLANNFKSCILLGPLLRPQRWKQISLLHQLAKRFLPKTKRVFTVNSHDEEFLQFLQYHDELQSKDLSVDWIGALKDYLRRFKKARVSEQTLHIIQGTADGTVDWQYNLPHLEKKFPKAKCYMIAEANHHIVNESPDYRNKAFSTITEILSADFKQKD